MRGTVFLAGFLLASSTFASAETMEVRPSAPVAEFNIPDGWKTSRVDRGIQSISADGEVDFWIESYTPDQFQKILDEHNAYWKDQGVVITSSDSETHRSGGKEVVVTTEHATWKGDPTVLYYIEFNLALPSKSNIVFTYWASPKGDKAFHDEIGDVIGSLKVTEE
jgi:hypothetical protein